MTADFPETFFKYYSADTGKTVLSTGKLKWSSPRLFNDPFDGQINLLLDPNEDALAEQIYESVTKEIFSPKPINAYISDDLNNIVNFLRLAVQASGYQFSDEDKEALREAAKEGAQIAISSFPAVNEQVKQINRDMCMLCVSEEKDSITMWGYYAKDHTGIALGFLPYIYDSPLSLARPVNYVSSIPRLSAEQILDNKNLARLTLDIISLTKYDKWGHEKEWRVVSKMRDKTKEFELLQFNKKELGSVILGAKISKQDRLDVIDLTNTKFPHAKLYQAILGESDFKIEFQEIDS